MKQYAYIMMGTLLLSGAVDVSGSENEDNINLSADSIENEGDSCESELNESKESCPLKNNIRKKRKYKHTGNFWKTSAARRSPSPSTEGVTEDRNLQRKNAEQRKAFLRAHKRENRNLTLEDIEMDSTNNFTTSADRRSSAPSKEI